MISFKTLVRVAALAAGIALGSSSAQAAVTLTFPDLTCNGMSMVDTGGGNFTVNCLQLTCTATADFPTQTPGTNIVLTGSCTGQAPVALAWTKVAGGDANCPAATIPTTGSPVVLTAPAANATATGCTYKLTGTDVSNQVGSKTVSVNWSNAPPPAPTGCSVTASPTSLPNTGGTSNVTVNCTGTPATNWTIKKNGVDWQTPSGNNVTVPDTLPANGGANTVTYAYTAVPSNGGTNGTANATNNVVSVAGVGGGGGGSCGTYWTGSVVNLGNFTWDSQRRDFDLGKGDNEMALLTYTVTAADAGKATHFSIAEFGGAAIYRTVWMSKNKCEMTGATKIVSNSGPVVYVTAGGVPQGSPNINMQVGETWYIMIRNWRFSNASNSCTAVPCATSFTPYIW